MEKELGQAYVNLEQMLREGRDLERAVLPLEMNAPAGASCQMPSRNLREGRLSCF